MNRCSEENSPRFSLAVSHQIGKFLRFSIAASARHIAVVLSDKGLPFMPRTLILPTRQPKKSAEPNVAVPMKEHRLKFHSHFLPTSLTDFRKGPNVCIDLHATYRKTVT